MLTGKKIKCVMKFFILQMRTFWKRNKNAKLKMGMASSNPQTFRTTAELISIKFRITWGSISSYSSRRSSTCWKFWSGWPSFNRCPSVPQTCSIALRSGLRTGQSITFRKFCTSLGTCGRALSCYKMNSGPIFFANGTTCGSETSSMYLPASIQSYPTPNHYELSSKRNLFF
jgi:hypothetical protein